MRAEARGSGDARGAGDLWTFRASSIAWAGLSVMAILYLASLVVFGGPTVGPKPQSKTVTDRLGQGQARRPSVAQPPDGKRDDSVLRANLTKLTAEIRSLRTAVHELRQRNDVLESRLASLEGAVGPSTSALPAGTKRARAAPRASRRKVRAGVPPVTVATSPMPTDGFGDSSLSASSVPMAAAKAPSRTMFGAELATGATTEALRVQWHGLRARHPAILTGLEIRRAGPSPGSQTRGKEKLRLVVGPFKNAADAARLCAQLRAAKAACKETVFSGKAL